VACLEFAANAGWWGVFETADKEWEARVRSAVRLLADTGFGGERSRGWGRAASPQFSDASNLFGNAAANGTWWLLSLYSPGETDVVDWSHGEYSTATRGGWTDSQAGAGPKKQVRMIEEGSVLSAGELRGRAVDVAPDGFAHPVYRAGFALAVPVPSVSQPLIPIPGREVETPEAEEPAAVVPAEPAAPGESAGQEVIPIPSRDIETPEAEEAAAVVPEEPAVPGESAGQEVFPIPSRDREEAVLAVVPEELEQPPAPLAQEPPIVVLEDPTVSAAAEPAIVVPEEATREEPAEAAAPPAEEHPASAPGLSAAPPAQDFAVEPTEEPAESAASHPEEHPASVSESSAAPPEEPAETAPESPREHRENSGSPGPDEAEE
jgi:CRISPR Csm4 C-terminal domain